MLHAQAQVAIRRGHDEAAVALRELFQELLVDEQPLRRLGGLMAGSELRYPFPGHDRHTLIGTFAPGLALRTDEGGSSLAALMHGARPVFVDLAGRADLREIAEDWRHRVDLHIAETDDRPADALLNPPRRPRRVGHVRGRTRRHRRARAARSALHLVRRSCVLAAVGRRGRSVGGDHDVGGLARQHHPQARAREPLQGGGVVEVEVPLPEGVVLRSELGCLALQIVSRSRCSRNARTGRSRTCPRGRSRTRAPPRAGST